MKTLLIFVFTCIFFSKIFSQAPVFALPSSGYTIRGGLNFIKVKNGYLGVRQVEHSKKFQNPYSIKSVLSVVNYDSKMVEVGENKLSDGELAYSLFKPQIVQGKKIWLICGDPGRSWDLGNIRAVEIDPETYKPGPSKIIVSTEELHESGEYAGFELTIKSSPNTKYHCLYYRGGFSNDFFVACLNEDFEPVWKGKKKIEKTNTEQINDVSITNNGEIIFTSVAKETATLSVYNIDGTEAHQKLNFDNAEPVFIDIFESKSGNTYVGGTLQKDSKLINAVFFAKMEKDYTLSNMKQVDFTDSILNRLAQHGLAKTSDKKRGLTGVHIQSQLVEQQDGRIKLVTETTYGDEGSSDYMGFGGLVVTDFSKTENQFSLIQKFMVDFNRRPRINQFVVMPSANSITLIYCDNEENINIDLKEKQKTLNGRAVGALMAAKIDNDGVIKREIIASRSNKDETKPTVEIIQGYIATKP